ncbi:MAG: glycosyltransferase [Patescibacteria group bacterium]
MHNISFVIITKNEEKRIGYVVRNLVKYGEVLVFDDYSTDKTQEIVESLGGIFITRPTTIKQPDTIEMYTFARQYIKNDWIFWGCSDHQLPVELLEKMREISLQNKYKYVQVPIFTYLFGDTKNPAHKGYNARFFKKDCVDFVNNYFHGLGKFTGSPDEILFLPMNEKYAIHHYSLYDLHKFVSKHLAYAEIEAQEKFERNKKFSIFLMLGAMLRYFVLFYKYSFRNGVIGLNAALLYVFFRLMVYAKLYELENGINLDSIEAEFAKSKEEIIKKIENTNKL